jgi:phospholipid/cholesterol/gamma-HCH transport system substrate-binding protein
MLPSGGVLSLRAADPFVDVDRILSVLHGDTRRRAQQALEGLGGALDRRGADLNALLQGVGQMIVNGAPVVHTLATDRAPLATLVANLAGIAQQIGSRGQALAGLSSDLVATFRALASRDDAVRSIIGQLPATLAQVRTTSGVLERTTGLAAPVISRLATAVRALSPAMHLLRPAADEAGAVVGELGGAAPRLRSTFAALQRIAPPLVGALPKLRAVLCQADPALRYLEPYARDLASMIEGVGAAVNEYDANGHTARLAIAVGPSSLYGGMSPSAAASLQILRRSGLVSQITQLGYDPYPPPGDANNTTIGRNTVGPHDDSPAYPHVLADC